MNDPATVSTTQPKATLLQLFAFRKLGFTQWLWLVISFLFFAALLRWTIHDFPFAAFWAGLQTAHPLWFAGAVATLFVGQTLRLLRWQRLLKLDQPATFVHTGKALMDGQMINWLSPIRLGDVWRIWQMIQHKPNTQPRNVLWAAVSIITEKSADSFVLACFALVLVFVTPAIAQNTGNTQTTPLLLRAIVVGVAFLLLMAGLLGLRQDVWQKRVLAKLPKAWRESLADDRLRLPAHIQTLIRMPVFWGKLLGSSAAIWVISVLTNILLARALNLSLSFSQQLLFTLAIQFGLVLSTVPANIGLFPLVASGVFGLFGIGSAQGIVFGSVLYVIVYGVNTLLWFIYTGITTFSNAVHLSTMPVAEPVVVGNVRVHALTAAQLMAHMHTAVQQKQPITVMYANAHAINLAQENPGLCQALNAANFVFCDGFGVQWASRFLGRPLPARLTPPDWIPDFAKQCAQNNTQLFLLGSQPGIGAQAIQQLQQSAPSLQAHAHHGYFNPNDADNDAVIAAINQSKAQVLLVGMGMPRQELWVRENQARLLHVSVIICVGALFNYLSGSVPRGPKWMTNSGLEWLARLWIEPRRLGKRYIVGNILFFTRVLLQKQNI